MDNHITNDPNNPINWGGENPTCNSCGETLNCFFDYEDVCTECFNAELTECCEAKFIGETSKCSDCNENATTI